ncbi:DUF6464 family protein [Leptolyngbya sp. 7M]|nr:hypothetical protein JVX88_23950 [Leptolyngbya sp. 7M]
MGSTPTPRRSSHIRCAVNPCGPCEGCSHYQELPIRKLANNQQN